MPTTNVRVNPWVPSRVPKAGLEVEYEQADDGSWGYRLTDPTGHVVHSRSGYGNAAGVSQAVNSWIRDRYKPDRVSRPSRPSSWAPVHRPSSDRPRAKVPKGYGDEFPPLPDLRPYLEDRRHRS